VKFWCLYRSAPRQDQTLFGKWGIAGLSPLGNTNYGTAKSSINARKSPQDQKTARLLPAALNHGESQGVYGKNKFFSRLCGEHGAALTGW